jgi:hypothetical protein
MTINQAIDKLTQISNTKLNDEQKELKISLNALKQKVGGRATIENCEYVKNIIVYGNKDGKLQ